MPIVGRTDVCWGDRKIIIREWAYGDCIPVPCEPFHPFSGIYIPNANPPVFATTCEIFAIATDGEREDFVGVSIDFRETMCFPLALVAFDSDGCIVTTAFIECGEFFAVRKAPLDDGTLLAGREEIFAVFGGDCTCHGKTVSTSSQNSFWGLGKVILCEQKKVMLIVAGMNVGKKTRKDVPSQR